MKVDEHTDEFCLWRT